MNRRVVILGLCVFSPVLLLIVKVYSGDLTADIITKRLTTKVVESELKDEITQKNTGISAEGDTHHPEKTVSQNPIDKSWRQTNCLVVEYRKELAQRLATLAGRKAPANDPEVIKLAVDIIDPIPSTSAIGIKRSREIIKTPQAEAVEVLTKRKRGGFFIECGALDGERSSNTIWLEQELGWTGLLIEMDPFFYTQLLGKNRRVLAANACLSPYKYITQIQYRGSASGQGQLLYQSDSSQSMIPRQSDTFVPCFPLESLLLAINQTRINYFSLDVEGAELDVLKTIPWNNLNIDILSVEYLHAPKGKSSYVNYMKTVGYKVYKDIHLHQPEQTLYVDDYIFVKETKRW